MKLIFNTLLSPHLKYFGRSPVKGEIYSIIFLMSSKMATRIVLFSLGVLLLLGCSASQDTSTTTVSSSTTTQTSTTSTTITTIQLIDLNNLPQFATANFTDLDKIQKISKFRSAIGHDYSDGRDTDAEGGTLECSMKHYIYPQTDYYDSTSEVEVYAPFDGTLWYIEVADSRVPDRANSGTRLRIKSTSYESVSVYFFHVQTVPSIFSLSWEASPESYNVNIPVSAGQLLGYADLDAEYEGATSDFDVAVWVDNPIGTTVSTALISIFEIMNDSAFASYEARGIASRESMIIPAEYRINNPVDWGNPDSGDWVTLE